MWNGCCSVNAMTSIKRVAKSKEIQLCIFWNACGYWSFPGNRTFCFFVSTFCKIDDGHAYVVSRIQCGWFWCKLCVWVELCFFQELWNLRGKAWLSAAKLDFYMCFFAKSVTTTCLFKGSLISVSFKLIILLVASWAIFFRRQRTSMPRVFMFRYESVLLGLCYVCSTAAVCTVWCEFCFAGH